MNLNPVACSVSVLAFFTVRLRPLFGSSVSEALHVRSTSWYLQRQTFFTVFLSLVAFPASVSAIPTYPPGLHLKRQGPPNNSSNTNNNNSGSISMSVWLPIILVTLVFVLFSFVTCIRRCAAADAVVADATTANQTAPRSVSGVTTRPYRRPRRTPSQISTKSLPAYMKEPGDQELVLFRGPPEMSMDDDTAPPHPMPTLAEDEEEHPEMRGATFDIPLNRVESVDTMPDSSTTDLIRRASASVPRPPELHRVSTSHDYRRSGDVRSMDSVDSDAELLAAHQRAVSVGNNTDSRGEAPSYTEAVSSEGRMATISLNDPEPHSDSPIRSSMVPGRGRFSFLTQNPFSSHTSGATSDANQSASSTRSESPAPTRNSTALSRLSTRESHESHHSRAPSRNNFSHCRSHSNTNLLRAFRSHSPGHAGTSTISVDSISAPLTHTLTRAEFHVPKGGLTPEQIKLITSREALERFGVPYGPDALAAFSVSRDRVAEAGPPPDFESVAGGSEGSSTEQRSETGDTRLARSTLPLSPQADEGAESSTSTVASYATAEEDSQAQIVPAPDVDMDVDELRTARPLSVSRERP